MKNNSLNKINAAFHNEKSVAIMLGISIHTLQKNRRQGKGPKYYKFGRSVRYSTDDILNYMEESYFNNTSEYGGKNA